jgi:hypothetical protein
MGNTTPGPTWVRGVARIVEGEIALDETTIETYSPMSGAGLLASLLAIEDEVGVARFASRFGLLRCRSGVLREPLADWWLERDVLRGTLALAHDLDAADGDLAKAEAEAAWRSTATDPHDSLRAARAVVEAMCRGLGETAVVLGEVDTVDRVHLGEPDDGRVFTLRATAGTLLGFAYLEAARLVTGKRQMRRCPDCGLVFAPTHRRQTYCSPQHASRARFRRYRDRRQSVATRHG